MNRFTGGKFRDFLSGLGYADFLINKSITDTFSYSIDTGTNSTLQEKIIIDYYYLTSEDELFYKHLSLWNENNKTSFIAVFDNASYIIDARQKPDIDQPLSKKVVIKSFEYGVNTHEYAIEQGLKLISKEGLDSSFYFDFVIEHQARKKAFEVDKDLLLNLLELRNDLVTKQNEHIIHLLLLRCLFVKYLEDRGVFEKDFLFKTLSAQTPEKLITSFRKIRKINGDLFKSNELQPTDLQPKYLKKLSDFFGYSDYRSKQGKFFPYQFDKIPIQLISSIYESFLKEKAKKESGVYYTPSFLVNFILRQSLYEKLQAKKNVTVFDPACGSGAFLVEAFRMLIKANKAEQNYEKKKQLLQTQLFGVDLDDRALQIAAFSLYLALLEGEKPTFIQEKIRLESPILPSLIGKTLIIGNAITDELKFEQGGIKHKGTFDCIIANPPWGSTPDDSSKENIKIREAIGNKEKAGTMTLYKSVSDFQRSQAFLLRAKEWATSDAIIAMVVNNSIFLNENAEEFRKELLTNNTIKTFYELSHINDMLFKKHKLGMIKNEPVEIGANEPCCVIIYEPFGCEKNDISYIHPKQNRFAENLRIISFGSKDILNVKQEDLMKEDLLWRIFVNGSWPDYQIIKKRFIERDKSIIIECRRGFQPKGNMKALGKPVWQKLIDINNFERYYLATETLGRFNWNQELHRKRKDETIYEGERIIIPVRPLASHGLRFSGVRLAGRFVHKDNIHSIKIKKNGNYISDYRPYLAIINSRLIGYYSHFISSQWGKGEAKRSTLRNVDIEKLPFPVFELNDKRVKRLCELVEKIEKQKIKGDNTDEIENEIDEIVYSLYNLTSYEKAVVSEFFDINYLKKDDKVTEKDLTGYGEKFADVFGLVIEESASVTVSYNISSNIGTVVCFTITKGKSHKGATINALEILQIVKKIQTERSFFSSILMEEKVKYYDRKSDQFFIIKSNHYSDWTERQAIDDANEEIADVIKYLQGNDTGIY